MTTYVEIDDEGGVYRAAWRLTSLGEQLAEGEEPPDPNSIEWGDDEFGEHMKNEYLKPAESGLPAPESAYKMRQDLANDYIVMGEAVQKAVEAYAVQELANSLDFESLLFEEEADSSPSGGGGGGVAPTSDQAAPTASEEPGPDGAATAFARTAIVYPNGDERTGSDPATDGTRVRKAILDASAMDRAWDDASDEPSDGPSDDPMRQEIGRIRLARQLIDPDEAREAIAAHVAASAETEAEPGEPGTDDASHVLDRRTFAARLLPDEAGPPGEEPAEESGPGAYRHRRVMWHVDGDDGRTSQA